MNRYAWCFLIGLIPTEAFVQATEAADWPQWQGQDRNAISREKGLLPEWPAEGPPLAWKINGLGGGDSAPAIAGGRVFGMSNRNGKEIVWAISAADGQQVWATSLGDAVQQGFPQSKEGPGCTPTVEGNRVYVIGMGGRVACLSVDGGKILWQRSMTRDFGGILPMWSYRESPLVDGNRLICTPGGSEATVVALDSTPGTRARHRHLRHGGGVSGRHALLLDAPFRRDAKRAAAARRREERFHHRDDSHVRLYHADPCRLARGG